MGLWVDGICFAFTYMLWSGSPYDACCPHHLNCCMSQDQPLLGCSLLLLIPGALCDKLTPCGYSSNLPGASLGTILVLRHNQPQAFTKLSAPYSEGEILHQSLDMITHLAWPPRLGGVSFPLCAKPLEHIWLQILVESCSFPSAPIHCFARSLYRGNISSIPWCLFSSACAGNDANYCVPSCSLKGIRNEAARIGLNTE